MRWQRHSDSDVLAFVSGLNLWRAAAPLAVGCFVLMIVGFTQVRTAVPAEGEEIVEGGEVVGVNDDGHGMPASNPRVKPMLAEHPNQFVTICVAGCSGKPSIVQTLPKPLEKRTGAMLTTASDGGAFGDSSADAVTCVAGCGGRPGQVVQRLPGLPALKAPPASDEDANPGR